MSKTVQSGIDIDLGNQCSRNAYSWAKKTFFNRPDGEGNPVLDLEAAFSNIMNFRGLQIGVSSDGIGSKIEIAERCRIYDTLGYDLVAMCADDLACNGMETVNLSNILDVDYLDPAVVDSLMRGLHDAAAFAHIVVSGGEIAELGERIGGYGEGMHFNWCATGIAILPPDLAPVDGRSIVPGDKVIALKSSGFRSNGFSLLRRIMQESFGDEWHRQAYQDKSWGEVLLAPSLIYSPLIAVLRRSGYNLKGIAHITGGGLADNFNRVLRISGLGAELSDIFKPQPFMTDVQKLGNISEEQAYRIWNMGNGMLLTVPADEADAVVDLAMEQEYMAKVCGSIREEAGIRIHTKGNAPCVLDILKSGK
ncbi:MAG: AIR synthase-related protein [Candidatus Neomarinimicrobiota bacterium]|jgi:phosphoribosylformylglycinamidine cyclo-ligase|nr:AIR synthase-related protein [Candidatus Neomarinimicrobiota bacterium]MDX9779507.1 AIR synthase-related protein [bacterium]